MPPRHFRSSRAPSRRRSAWGTLDVSSGPVAAGSSTNVDLFATSLGAAGASTVGITIVRTHVRIMVPWALQADTITWGLIVGRADDVGTNRPSPAAGGDKWAMVVKEFPDTTGVGFTPGEQVVYTYDIKAKRKLDEVSERWLFSWFNGAAGNKTISIYVRSLALLP